MYSDPITRAKLRDKLIKKLEESRREPVEILPTEREIFEQAKIDMVDVLLDEAPVPWPEELCGQEAFWLNSRFNQLMKRKLSGDEERFLALCPPPKRKER